VSSGSHPRDSHPHDSGGNDDFRAHILVVDGDVRGSKRLVAALKEEGHEVIWARDGEVGYNVLDSEEPVDVMITELNAHHIDGMRLLQISKKRHPEICVIVIAREPEIELATEAMRMGAYDFQTKPLNVKKLSAVIHRGLSHQKLAVELTELKRRMDHRYGLDDIIGGSPQMIDVFDRIKQVADTRATVLVTGETGTGKELVAKAIHHHSPRRDSPFVMLNCAALAEGVIESELFGHEKGAFTGALTERRGRFEIADGGTLFLDEVGEMPLSTQAKLLRVLQEREFERVGGNKVMRVDVRVIAATNRDLEKLVEQGRYRETLYYRLNVAKIEMPPLRDRKPDIPLLVDAFIKEFNSSNDRDVTGITRGATDCLLQYDWPGNVRELKNVIEGMVVFCSSKRLLEVGDLPLHLRRQDTRLPRIPARVGMTMNEIERTAIQETLKHVGHDKQKAADMLRIGLRTLYRKIKEYEIS
jgi:DNA-binding NtrC family response regulator